LFFKINSKKQKRVTALSAVTLFWIKLKKKALCAAFFSFGKRRSAYVVKLQEIELAQIPWKLLKAHFLDQNFHPYPLTQLVVADLPSKLLH
jgi:hypothetical protein